MKTLLLAALALLVLAGAVGAQAFLDTDGDNFFDPDPTELVDRCPDEPGAAPDGCPPSAYPEPTETGRTHACGWTPPSGTVAVNPRVACSSGATGVNLTNDDVWLVNPSVDGPNSGRAVYLTGDDVHLLGDPDAPGYADDDAAMVRLANAGVVVNGASDYEIDGVFFRNLYRPISIWSSCGPGRITDNDIRHPRRDITYPSGPVAPAYNSSIVGIKGIADFSRLCANDKSVSGLAISGNHIEDVQEESISLDGNGSEPADATVRGTGAISSVDPVNDTVPRGGGRASAGASTGSFSRRSRRGAAGR